MALPLDQIVKLDCEIAYSTANRIGERKTYILDLFLAQRGLRKNLATHTRWEKCHYLIVSTDTDIEKP